MKKVTAIITAIAFVVAGIWLYIKKATFFKWGSNE
jgi:uncharacterized protein YoxC